MVNRDEEKEQSPAQLLAITISYLDRKSSGSLSTHHLAPGIGTGTPAPTAHQPPFQPVNRFIQIQNGLTQFRNSPAEPNGRPQLMMYGATGITGSGRQRQSERSFDVTGGSSQDQGNEETVRFFPILNSWCLFFAWFWCLARVSSYRRHRIKRGRRGDRE